MQFLILKWLLGLYIACFGFTECSDARQIKFKMTQTVAGAGGDDSGVLSCSQVECAARCLPHCGCTGFSFSVRGECVLSTSADNLPTGTWKVFTKRCVDRGSSPVPPHSTVLVNRFDGTVDFDRTWAEYEAGFGDAGGDGEGWLGLATLHTYTSACAFCLRVDIQAWDDSPYWAEYESISVASAADNYRISMTRFNPLSSAGDSLTNNQWGDMYRLNDKQFSTMDADNDPSTIYHCASLWHGGWWYGECNIAHPTGLYLTGGQQNWEGVVWRTIPDFPNNYSYKRMKLIIVPTG